MFPTDVAQICLAQVRDNTAQALLIQMRASLSVRKTEMGRIRRVDAVADLLTVTMGYGCVFVHRIAVNIDLPADTAAVGAFVCDAGKILVVSGGVEFYF
jgi:hypothetical protein